MIEITEMYRKAIVLFILSSLFGCKSKLSVVSNQVVVRITNLDRLATHSNESVTVEGRNLTSGITAEIDGVEINFSASSDQNAVIEMPDVLKPGLFHVKFKLKDTVFAIYPLMNADSIADLPELPIQAQIMCNDQIFKNVLGELVRGLRNCEGSHPDCTEDGESACVTTNSFRAALLDGLAQKIIAGQTVAGVAGGVATRLCSVDGDQGCSVSGAAYKAALVTAIVPSDIKAGKSLAGISGALPECNSDGMSGCVSTSQFHAADISGASAKLLLTTRLAGVDGLALPRPSDCSADGQLGCVSKASFPAVNLTNFSAWDLRADKIVGGVTGKLTFYRNMANTTSVFDRLPMGIDLYDTIEDLADNFPFPTETPMGFAQATGSNWILDPTLDSGAGGGTAGNGICDGSEACTVYLDQIAHMFWAKDTVVPALVNWDTAISECENLSVAGKTDWRLPTQKEFMQAYINGIWSQKNLLNLSDNYYWSATTKSDTATPGDSAIYLTPSSGAGAAQSALKSFSYYSVCISN
jgi:hypothetical protein